jgi:alpha-tubulin suppressor-like RCC1 family protein
MAFFQNPFEFEFRTNLFQADNQYTLGWQIGANRNKSDYMVAYNTGTYDMTTNDTLTINYAIDPDLLHFHSFDITISGLNQAAVTAQEVLNSLASNSTFNEYFTAQIYAFKNNDPNKTIIIKAKQRAFFRCYISNKSAEFALAFNKYAPVKELPDLFQQYSIQNIFNYYNYGSQRILYLDPNDPNDIQVILNAGLDPFNPTPDWKLLAGASDAFHFTKNYYNSNGDLDYTLYYQSGSKAGMLAKKTVYGYDENGNLIGKCEIPYILTESDLCNPTPAIMGTLWGWGNNADGQLGNDTNTYVSSPVQTICGGSNWVGVECGYFHTIALKNNGSLWDWGYGGEGAIGDNQTLDRSSPVQTITNGTNWMSVDSATENGRAFGIKMDGTLWGWGHNATGELGDDSTNWKSSPVQTVTNGTNWKQVASGAYHTAGIKKDGTLWMWGSNYCGQLGDDTTITVSSPIQTICGGTNWKQVSCGYCHTAAIKNDGTLWMWGSNYFGELGIDNTAFQSSPVQTICGGTNWKQVSCGDFHTVALKNDGTLWLWGKNAYGELGDETTIDKSSPIQTITGGTSWKQCSGGQHNTAAIKNDGTLWVWGFNVNGELGCNDTTNRSSPIQTIMADNNWLSVSAGTVHMFGIRKA